MEEKKKFTLDDVPGGYAMCTRNDCEVCNHCLRHLAFQKVGKDLKALRRCSNRCYPPSIRSLCID